jgi:hypothetical protein
MLIHNKHSCLKTSNCLEFLNVFRCILTKQPPPMAANALSTRKSVMQPSSQHCPLFFTFSGFQCKAWFAAEQLRKAIRNSLAHQLINPDAIIQIEGDIVETRGDFPTLYSWTTPHRVRDFTAEGELYRVDLTRPTTMKHFRQLGRQAAEQMQRKAPELDTTQQVVIFCYSQGALVATEAVKRLFWNKKTGWSKDILLFCFAGTATPPPVLTTSVLPPKTSATGQLTLINFYDPRDKIIPAWHHHRTAYEWSQPPHTSVLAYPSEIATAHEPFHGMYVPHVEQALTLLAAQLGTKIAPPPRQEVSTRGA